MAGLDDTYDPGWAAIAVTSHRQAANAAGWHAAVKVMMLRDVHHGTGGLARGQHDQPPGWGRWQMRPQAALGVRGGHRRAEQSLEKKPCRSHQGSSSRGQLRPLAWSAARLVHRGARKIAKPAAT